MLTIYITLLTISVLAVFVQAHRQMLKPVYPAAKPMHIITASDEALYFTPKENTVDDNCVSCGSEGLNGHEIGCRACTFCGTIHTDEQKAEHVFAPCLYDDYQEHTMHTKISTPWPLTATDTTTCEHRPWSGWITAIDGDYPIGFVAVCEACETNIAKTEDGWVDHGTVPSQRNLDTLHAEKRTEWYDPENADGFWNED